MKKFLLLPLLLFSPLFALPLGNPMDASLYHSGLVWGDCYEDRCCDPCDTCFSWCDAWSFRLGFYGDYVFNRHMERNCGGDLYDFEIYTNAALLVVNFCDRLDVFGTIGATNINLTTHPHVFRNPTTNALLFLETETDVSWSIGGRLTIWDCDCWYFGIEGQYFYTKPDVHLVEVPGVILANPDDSIEVEYTEWQVGVGAAYFIQIGCSGLSLIPYTGVKWAGSCADFDNGFIPFPLTVGPTTTLVTIENKKSWGWALGTTLLFCDALSITVEGRWADEKAIHVNGQFRF